MKFMHQQVKLRQLRLSKCQLRRRNKLKQPQTKLLRKVKLKLLLNSQMLKLIEEVRDEDVAAEETTAGVMTEGKVSTEEVVATIGPELVVTEVKRRTKMVL